MVTNESIPTNMVFDENPITTSDENVLNKDNFVESVTHGVGSSHQTDSNDVTPSSLSLTASDLLTNYEKTNFLALLSVSVHPDVDDKTSTTPPLNNFGGGNQRPKNNRSATNSITKFFVHS